LSRCGESALALLENSCRTPDDLSAMVMPTLQGLVNFAGRRSRKLLPRTEVSRLMTGHGSIENRRAIHAPRALTTTSPNRFSSARRIASVLRRMAEKIRLVEENEFCCASVWIPKPPSTASSAPPQQMSGSAAHGLPVSRTRAPPFSSPAKAAPAKNSSPAPFTSEVPSPTVPSSPSIAARWYPR